MIYSFILYFISFILLVVEVLILDILPIKYLGILILFLGSLSLILFFVKKINKISKVVVIVINIIISIILLVTSIYVIKTNNFLGSLSINNKEIVSYYLISNSSNENVKIVGTLDNKDIYYLDAINRLEEKYNCGVVNFETKENLFEAINNNSISHIFISSLYMDDFSLFNITDEIDIPILATKLKNNEIKSNFNLLVSGIDTYGDISKIGRSDVNIVMSVNLDRKEILLVHIPRDYYVYLDGIGDIKDKLTHSGYYGIEVTKKTIENLLDVKIDYYVKLNFDTLIKFVDSIGGIQVYSDVKFNKFKKGINNLNGSDALLFSRIRKSFVEGDIKRGEHQLEVIRGIINKVSSSKTILYNYLNILDSLEGNIEINFNNQVIKNIVKLQINDMSSYDIKTFGMYGEHKDMYTYSIPNELLYVFEPDLNVVMEVHDLITKMGN